VISRAADPAVDRPPAHPVNAAPVRVEVVSREAVLSPHREVWECLYRSTTTEPSTAFEWADALTRSHLAPEDRFVLLRITRGQDVMGLVPLVSRRVVVLGYSVTLLSPLAEGRDTHSDLLAVGIDGEMVRALFSALTSLDIPWDVFRMSRLLTDHAILRHADDCLRGVAASSLTRTGDASYFLSLPATFDAYLAQRSAKFRNHLKRTERKMREHGAVDVVTITRPGDVPAAYEMLLGIERASWKQDHGTAISAVNRQARFYRELCEGAAAAGRLHLHFLTVSGQAAAYNLGLIANGCYSYLKTSYDEQFKPLGAATYLRARLVETLIRAGVHQLDFPAEPYEWERQWTDTVRWHQVLNVYRPTAAGRVLAWVDRLRHRSAGARNVEHADPRAVRPSPEAVR
jgi:CelD/BcsL family acetyltransferase involved in cellulose biosynthesis